MKKIPAKSKIKKMQIKEFISLIGLNIPGLCFTHTVWVMFDENDKIFGISREVVYPTDKWFVDVR